MRNLLSRLEDRFPFKIVRVLNLVIFEFYLFMAWDFLPLNLLHYNNRNTITVH